MKGEQIVRIPLEILQDSAIDLDSLVNTAAWSDDDLSGFDAWLARLEKLLRSQSRRDRLSKSLPGVEKAEKGMEQSVKQTHTTTVQAFT